MAAHPEPRGSFSVVAESMNEYREAVRNAEALGFTVDTVGFNGAWEDSQGRAIFIGGCDLPVEKVGRDYLHVPVDGETCPVKPAEGHFRGDAGSVRLHFRVDQ